MDESNKVNTANDESVSKYLSFVDAEDTMSHTANNTFKSVKDFSNTNDVELELVDRNKTLEVEFLKNNNSTNINNFSPLRPFDNILFKINALSSTPSKASKKTFEICERSTEEVKNIKQMKKETAGNKENCQPDNREDVVTQSVSLSNDPSSFHQAKLFSFKSIKEDKTTQSFCIKEIGEQCQLELYSSSGTDRELTTDSKLEQEEDISVLIDKMLKMTENNEKKNKTIPNSAHTSVLKKRSTLLPVTGREKRSTYAFKQRMSIVKTTLNSPSRKIANQMGTLVEQHKTNAFCNLRKTLLPKTKSISTGNCRKSFIPVTTQSVFNRTKSNIKVTNIQKAAACTVPKFLCTTCKLSFRVKSLLDAHKQSHKVDPTPYINLTKTNVANSDVNPSTSQLGIQTRSICKYCDKRFALERALHIHLLQNCTKIPPSDKRKLEFTELNHVEKAQLPVFTHAQNVDKKFTKPNSATKILNKRDLVRSEISKTSMPPPSTSGKLTRPKTPHSGVCKTPTKSVPCHICKQSFKSILDYTTHCLTMHSKNQENISSTKWEDVISNK